MTPPPDRTYQSSTLKAGPERMKHMDNRRRACTITLHKRRCVDRTAQLPDGRQTFAYRIMEGRHPTNIRRTRCRELESTAEPLVVHQVLPFPLLFRGIPFLKTFTSDSEFAPRRIRSQKPSRREPPSPDFDSVKITNWRIGV
jgi:hypothetical protein